MPSPSPLPLPDAPARSKYADERYNPTFGHCANLSLTFDGSFLRMSGGSKLYAYIAASGRKTDKGFDYSAQRQKQPKEGPIPEGEYWIRLDELQDTHWYRFANPAFAWGNHWISIHPLVTTETLGRGGFFIHGGSELGSAGCIDLAGEMDQFVSDLVGEAGGRSKCQIHLLVKYK